MNKRYFYIHFYIIFVIVIKLLFLCFLPSIKRYGTHTQEKKSIINIQNFNQAA